MAGRGVFLVFEGGEGAGKSSQATMLAVALRERGLDVVRTREPGGSQIGLAIRAVLLEADEAPSQHAEALLYAADRADHVAKVVGPALRAGKVVICDRYFASTLAYQGAASGIDEAWLWTLFNQTAGALYPDRTFLLDVDPLLGLKRAKGRGETNRFEEADLDFHKKVRVSFLQQAQEARAFRVEGHARRVWNVVDGAQDEQTIHQGILSLALETCTEYGHRPALPADPV